MKTCLDCDADRLTPNELLTAILKAPAELFWLGGIGIYFKADQEENWRVGDRGNDAIRINASEMRMHVVGEGANLGLTQQARIAFARNGGAINTDAIDNSAGVDSSDHEVNIKILLREAIQRGELARETRDTLLAEMTDDVAQLVLQHNYDQTRALTLAHTTGAAYLNAHHRFINFWKPKVDLTAKLRICPLTPLCAG
ncbi:MAG: NAD-glutamate dehydrogenase domain-containing protein [Pseudomonadota bacterium]